MTVYPDHRLVASLRRLFEDQADLMRLRQNVCLRSRKKSTGAIRILTTRWVVAFGVVDLSTAEKAVRVKFKCI